MSRQPCTSPVMDGLPSQNSATAILVDVRTGDHPAEGYAYESFPYGNCDRPGKRWGTRGQARRPQPQGRGHAASSVHRSSATPAESPPVYC